MCATNEGRQKGEKWCKRAIWQNTLPTIKLVFAANAARDLASCQRGLANRCWRLRRHRCPRKSSAMTSASEPGRSTARGTPGARGHLALQPRRRSLNNLCSSQENVVNVMRSHSFAIIALLVLVSAAAAPLPPPTVVPPVPNLNPRASSFGGGTQQARSAAINSLPPACPQRRRRLAYRLTSKHLRRVDACRKHDCIPTILERLFWQISGRSTPAATFGTSPSCRSMRLKRRRTGRSTSSLMARRRFA